MELRCSSWAVRPLSALADRGDHARQVQGQLGGRCLQATEFLLWGPGSLDGRDTRLESSWTGPPPPRLGAACSLLDGRDGQPALMALSE